MNPGRLAIRAGKALNVLLRPFGVKLIPVPPSPYQLEVYPVSARPSSPRYLNIGANAFRHPYWHNLDHPTSFEGFARNQKGNIDIPHDLLSADPIPVADGSLAIAYCSHVIEHLPDEAVQRLFAEAYRMLEPGGTFRVVAPDMHFYYRAYQRRDEYCFRESFRFHGAETIEQMFLEKFATALTLKHPDPRGCKASDVEVARVMAVLPEAEAFDYFCRQVPEEVQRDHPADHMNWFTEDKVEAMLKDAGFVRVVRSRAGQSDRPELRSLVQFDSHPEESFFVEAVTSA